MPGQKKNKVRFKPGDLVRDKGGSLARVLLVPGMEEYDRKRFGWAEKGMIVRHCDGDETWEYQEDYELVPKKRQSTFKDLIEEIVYELKNL